MLSEKLVIAKQHLKHKRGAFLELARVRERDLRYKVMPTKLPSYLGRVDFTTLRPLTTLHVRLVIRKNFRFQKALHTPPTAFLLLVNYPD